MDIVWTPVADRVWMTTTQPDDANVVLVAGDERAMLVDAGDTAEVGAALQASAAGLAGVPVEVAVITHHHHDHWNGVAGLTDVEVIGHENLLELDPPSELRPTTTFTLIHTVQLGDCFVEITHFGPAHTRSDVVVLVPSREVLVVGDLVEEEPQFDEYASPSTWPRVLDSVVGSARPRMTFIPGHGQPCDRSEVVLNGIKLSQLYGTIGELVEQGVQPDDIVAATDDWPYSEATIRAALPLALAQLAEQGVVPRRQLPITQI